MSAHVEAAMTLKFANRAAAIRKAFISVPPKWPINSIRYRRGSSRGCAPRLNRSFWQC
jgi:hypothetical protein